MGGVKVPPTSSLPVADLPEDPGAAGGRRHNAPGDLLDYYGIITQQNSLRTYF